MSAKYIVIYHKDGILLSAKVTQKGLIQMLRDGIELDSLKKLKEGEQ